MKITCECEWCGQAWSKGGVQDERDVRVFVGVAIQGESNCPKNPANAKPEPEGLWDYVDTGQCLDVWRIFVRVPASMESERKYAIRDAARVVWEDSVNPFTAEQREKARRFLYDLAGKSQTLEPYNFAYKFFEDIGLLTREDK